MKQIFIALSIAACMLASCDSEHSSEFRKIDRHDIAGYEEFIRKYPESSYVNDAKERIEVAREELRRQEEYEIQRQLEMKYGDNSLANNSEPYSRWYGSNAYYDDYTEHSEIKVRASNSSDVVVVVRYNNANGAVAGHKYIKAGSTGTIYLQNGKKYQTFFYSGNGWNPNKSMSNGIVGGFVKNESFSKDENSQYLYNEVLSYTLTSQLHGNFSPGESNSNEIF